MDRGDGKGLRASGAANTHADFRGGFLEVVSFVRDDGDDGVPADAQLVPLEAPPEGFAVSDIDTVAQRLTSSGSGMAAYATVHRPVLTPSGLASSCGGPAAVIIWSSPERSRSR